MEVEGAHSQVKGITYACTGALFWGFSGVCAQYLFDNYEIGSSFITMARSVCAALCFAVLLAACKGHQVKELLSRRANFAWMALLGASLFGSQLFFVMSVGTTNAGTATVLQMSYMVFVIVFTCIMTRALPSLRELAAFGCAVAGTWMIATQGDLSTLSLPPQGIVLGLLNGLCGAIYIVFPRPLYDRYDDIAVIGCGMAANALVACLFWVAGTAMAPQAPIPDLDAAGILALVGGVGFLGTFAAFGLYLKGVAMVGSVKGGLLGALEPIGAMAISAVWLGTAFTGADWAGLALMLVMLALVTFPQKRSDA